MCSLRSTPDISNCKYYQASRCAKCVDGYFLNTTFTCVNTALSNCLFMDFVEHKCKKCANDYFIDTNGTCATIGA